MSGCPYIKFNEKKNCEVCELTGKPTGVSLLCDFDYDEQCRRYKRQQAKLKKTREKK